MSSKVKAILPSKIKDDAFRKEFAKGIERTAKQAKRLFEQTTQTWQHKPVFIDVTKIIESELEASVFTTDEIYAYVNDGTPPHAIAAKNAPALAFPSEFRPKTQPGMIGSNPGFVGGKTRFAKVVSHPGTRARNFDEKIAQEMEAFFESEMDRAMGEGARDSGHLFE